jgi:hypothetical protein
MQIPAAIRDEMYHDFVAPDFVNDPIGLEEHLAVFRFQTHWEFFGPGATMGQRSNSLSSLPEFVQNIARVLDGVVLCDTVVYIKQV